MKGLFGHWLLPVQQGEPFPPQGPEPLLLLPLLLLWPPLLLDVPHA